MKKIVWLVVLLLVGLSFGIGMGFDFGKKDEGEMSAAGKQELVVRLRDEGIAEAKARGEYRCCIEPDCTMCYMEANPWNGFEAGTCKCDDLLAQGKDACPQCKNGLCESGNEDFCEE